MEPYLLELRNVTKRYPGVTALDDVSLGLAAGQVHAIVGANGAGKSTLVKIAAGAQPMDQGRLILEGESLKLRTPRDAIDCGIHTIHQELHLAPHLSVAENILLGRIPRNRWGLVDRDRLHNEAASLLRSLEVPIDVKTPVSALSIAQCQFVEIAKSLGQKCKVLILDEPSAVLARRDLRTLFRVIRSLKEGGATILYISHRLEEVFEISDWVTVIRDGRNVLSRSIREVSADGLIEAMTGRALEEMWSRRAHEPGEVILEVEGLSRDQTVKGVSFQVRRGEIVGLAGKIGAGRTDVARTIFGAEVADRGSVRLFGRPVRIRSPRDAIVQGVGLVPEDRKNQGLLLHRNIIENVALSNVGRFVRWGFLKLKAEFQQIQRLCASLKVRATGLQQVVRTLSGGNQQKVVLARWLNSDAEILILDEPTRGVDVGAKVELYNLMEEFTRKGKAILMISSEDAELLQLADRVVVMSDGCVTGALSREQIGNNWSVVEKLMEGRQAD